MSDAVSCVEEIVNWHPRLGDGSSAKDIALPTIHGDLDRYADQPLTVFLVGYGEGRASGEAAVAHWDSLGMPAVAAWLSYRAIPVTQANMTRTAVEAPLAIAEHYAGNRPVRLVTNSLGCLGVNAAAEAPERFTDIASIAPYALANEARGRLPLVGSPFATRAAALGVRLAVRTPIQLWSERHNPDLRDVARTAIQEVRLFGAHDYRVALDHALSPQIGRRTAQSYVRLMADHPTLLAIGESDKLITATQARCMLGIAALGLDVDPTPIDGIVAQVPGPHSPWCIPQGTQQLAVVGEWMIGRDTPAEGVAA